MPATNILSYFRKQPRLHAPNSDPISESDSNNRSSSNKNNSSQLDSSSNNSNSSQPDSYSSNTNEHSSNTAHSSQIYLPNDIGSKESGPAQPILPVYPRDANITNPRY